MNLRTDWRVYMSSQLFFTNIPHDCSDSELKEWIESRGIEIVSIRMIRDLVSGASPSFAYAATKDTADIEQAVSVLHGTRMRSQTILVSLVVSRSIVK
jgi:RNA recognition motif-containing protein